MTWYRHAHCFKEHVYQVSFEYMLLLLSHEVRLKFCDDDTDNDAKRITIVRKTYVLKIFIF